MGCPVTGYYFSYCKIRNRIKKNSACFFKLNCRQIQINYKMVWDLSGIVNKTKQNKKVQQPLNFFVLKQLKTSSACTSWLWQFFSWNFGIQLRCVINKCCNNRCGLHQVFGH